MPPRLLLLAILPLLALAPPLSRAEQPAPFPDDAMQAQIRQAEELARRAGEDLLHSFQVLQSAIPRYGVPYIDGNGDIVIPRRHRPPPNGTMPFRDPDTDRT